MNVVTKIQMTHATKNGKLAFINDVDNGLACGCKC
ncbi:uncharacterized protein METZ01_LOCUS436901, partial [marine metagenome]